MPDPEPAAGEWLGPRRQRRSLKDGLEGLILEQRYDLLHASLKKHFSVSRAAEGSLWRWEAES